MNRQHLAFRVVAGGPSRRSSGRPTTTDDDTRLPRSSSRTPPPIDPHTHTQHTHRQCRAVQPCCCMLWRRPLRSSLVSFAAMSSSSSSSSGVGDGGAAAVRVLIAQPDVYARKKAKFVAEGASKLQVGRREVGLWIG